MAGVTGRVLLQVVLVVVLGWHVVVQWQHLGHDGSVKNRLLRDVLNERVGNGLVFWRTEVNAAAVLGARVIALAVQRRRIVHRPEGLEDLLVGDHRRIEFHLDDLGVRVDPPMVYRREQNG